MREEQSRNTFHFNTGEQGVEIDEERALVAAGGVKGEEMDDERALVVGGEFGEEIDGERDLVPPDKLGTRWSEGFKSECARA